MVVSTDSEIFEELSDSMKTLLLLILEILPIFNIYKVGFAGFIGAVIASTDLSPEPTIIVICLDMLEGMQREYDMIDDGSKLGPIEVYNVLERIMYNRRYVVPNIMHDFACNRYLNFLFRSKNNPYWNTLVISGYDVNADEPFLGQIDSQVSD